MIKNISILIIIILFQSCCMITSSKCNISETAAAFKIVDRVTQRDLLFGQYKQYDLDSIKLYSLNNNDTVFYSVHGNTFTGLPQDSLLFTDFNNQTISTVFVKLNSSDIDTLNLNYEIIDPKSCCEEYSLVKLLSYNIREVRPDNNYYMCFK